MDVFPNLSLLVGGDDGRSRELHRLYRRGATVLRTPSLGQLIRASVRQLDTFVAPPDGLVRLRADLLVGEHGAVLVHDPWTQLRVPDRRLAALGWARSDGAAPMLDRATGDVVVTLPRFSLDESVAAEVDTQWPVAPGEGRVAPGRYRVHAIVLLGATPDHLKVASPARRVASLASLLDTSAHPARAIDVAAMGRLEGRAEIVRAIGMDLSEVVGILRDLAQ